LLLKLSPGRPSLSVYSFFGADSYPLIIKYAKDLKGELGALFRVLIQ